jgi:hypothetical protein
MDFRALGPIEAQHDGRVLAIGGARQKALLPLLLIKSPEVVSRDTLIEKLWRGDPAPIEVPQIPVTPLANPGCCWSRRVLTEEMWARAHAPAFA